MEITSILQRKKTRLIVKRGNENFAVKTVDIALIYREELLVFIIDKNGQKYTCASTLTDLEDQLDDRIFFRANRKFIINVNFVKSYRAYERVKIHVLLFPPHDKHQIIVSQEGAANFKGWLNEA